MVIPQSKGLEAFALLDKLNAIKASEASGFDFAIMRLYKIIKEIEKTQPVQAYCLWGGYYSLLEDKESTHKYFELALKECPGAVIYFNYSVSLSNLGERDMALEMIQKALKLDPTNLKYIADMLGMSKIANEEELYEHWVKKYGQLVKTEEDINQAEDFHLACQSDSFRDWESSSEEEAWKHLQ